LSLLRALDPNQNTIQTRCQYIECHEAAAQPLLSVKHRSEEHGKIAPPGGLEAMGTREVAFKLHHAAPFAVQLRLTPELLAALREARQRGEQPTIQLHAPPAASVSAAPAAHESIKKWRAAIRPSHSLTLPRTFFVSAQVITVGGAAHRFNATPDAHCTVLRLPPAGAPAAEAEVVGSVRQKLKLARTLHDGLGSAPTAVVQHAKPPVLLPASALPARGPAPAALKPPAQPQPQPQPQPKQRAARPAQPTPPGPAAAAPQHRSSASPTPGAALSRRVLAAAAMGRLRLVLVALLAERPLGKQAISAALAAAEAGSAQRLRLPASKEEVERAIKAVATFTAPGVYTLNPGLEGELQGLPPPEARPPGGGGKRPAAAPGGHRAAKRPQPTPSLPSAATATASVGEGGGSAGGSGARRAGSRPPSSRSAGSRGSDGADESWVLELAGRQPRPVPPVTSAQVSATARACACWGCAGEPRRMCSPGDAAAAAVAAAAAAPHTRMTRAHWFPGPCRSRTALWRRSTPPSTPPTSACTSSSPPTAATSPRWERPPRPPPRRRSETGWRPRWSGCGGGGGSG
jgi:hypothetical protein